MIGQMRAAPTGGLFFLPFVLGGIPLQCDSVTTTKRGKRTIITLVKPDAATDVVLLTFEAIREHGQPLSDVVPAIVGRRMFGYVRVRKQGKWWQLVAELEA